MDLQQYFYILIIATMVLINMIYARDEILNRQRRGYNLQYVNVRYQPEQGVPPSNSNFRRNLDIYTNEIPQYNNPYYRFRRYFK